MKDFDEVIKYVKKRLDHQLYLTLSVISVAIIINLIIQILVIGISSLSFYFGLIFVIIFGYIIRKYNLRYERLWNILREGKSNSLDRSYRRFRNTAIAIAVLSSIFKLIITPTILLNLLLPQLILSLIIVFFLVRFFKYVIDDRKIKVLLYMLVILLPFIGVL